MIIVCTTSAVAANLAVKRWRFLRFPLLIIGFFLLALNLLSILFVEHFYLLLAESFFAELLYGCSFYIIGIISRIASDTSFRRIISLLFFVLLSYLTFADDLLYNDEIRFLQGKVVDGVTKQSTSYSCVAASLSTLLRQWGLEYTEGDTAYALRTRLTGSRMSRVPLAVHKLGEVKKLQAKVIRTNWDELRKLDVPCLLSVK
ncbi:MAG: cysteine peptidase family C39 domain-containing protein, partial [Planctomycetota bacterium]